MNIRQYLIIFFLFASIIAVEDMAKYLDIDDWDTLDAGEIVLKKTINGYKNGDFTLYKKYSGNIDSLFLVITNFNDYPNFMPHVTNIKTLKTYKKETEIEYYIEFFYGFQKKYKLLMKEEIIDEKLYLFWKKIPWDDLYSIETIRDTYGYWELRKINERESLIIYNAFIDPGLVPYGINSLIDIIIEASLPAIINKSIERSNSFN